MVSKAAEREWEILIRDVGEGLGVDIESKSMMGRESEGGVEDILREVWRKRLDESSSEGRRPEM